MDARCEDVPNSGSIGLQEPRQSALYETTWPHTRYRSGCLHRCVEAHSPNKWLQNNLPPAPKTVAHSSSSSRLQRRRRSRSFWAPSSMSAPQLAMLPTFLQKVSQLMSTMVSNRPTSSPTVAARSSKSCEQPSKKHQSSISQPTKTARVKPFHGTYSNT